MNFHDGLQSCLLTCAGQSALMGRLAGIAQLATLKAIVEIQIFLLLLVGFTILEAYQMNFWSPYFSSIRKNFRTQQWGFSGLQNQGCRFLQHAKIFSHHAKIFEANLINFSKTLDIKCFIKKGVLTKMAKIFRLQKYFLIMEKFLHDAAKITFCSPERQGQYWFIPFFRDLASCPKKFEPPSIRPLELETA